jgi:hypothetical protein
MWTIKEVEVSLWRIHLTFWGCRDQINRLHFRDKLCPIVEEGMQPPWVVRPAFGAIASDVGTAGDNGA